MLSWKYPTCLGLSVEQQVVVALAHGGGRGKYPECGKQCAIADQAPKRSWRHLDTMPIFLTMTAGLDEPHRAATASKASISAFATIVLFAMSGQLLFRFFGISIHSFRIVGGVIFFLMGMDMLQTRLGRVKVKESDIKDYVNDISITPLAIPVICGPGALTNAIVLMEDADMMAKKVVLICAIAVVMLLTYLILYSASRLVALLGDTGLNVMMRLMGLVVMVIAVEFFFSGLKPILADFYTTTINPST